MTEGPVTLPGFPPEFVELFTAASQCERVIDLETPDDATRLRYRLNDFRRKLRKSNHPIAVIADNVEICLNRIGDEPRARRLIARPRDMKTLQALHAAGISGDNVGAAGGAAPTREGFNETLHDLYGEPNAGKK